MTTGFNMELFHKQEMKSIQDSECSPVTLTYPVISRKTFLTKPSLQKLRIAKIQGIKQALIRKMKLYSLDKKINMEANHVWRFYRRYCWFKIRI